jgi:hypothetical protein
MVGLTIRLMGNPEITIGQRPLSFRTRKELAILIYVLNVEHPHFQQIVTPRSSENCTLSSASIAGGSSS